MDNSVNTPLRDDVRLLGDLLGQCLRQQAGDDLYQTIETIRKASVTTRGEQGAALSSLRDLLSPWMTPPCWKWPAPSASFSI